MKKIIVGALALILTAGAAEAQVKENGKEKGTKEARKANSKSRHGKEGMAFHKLNLTEAQKTRLKAIREQQSQELKALKSNDQITVKARQEQRRAIHEKYKAQYQAVLTQERKDQLAKFKAENTRPGKPAAGARGPKRGQSFAKDLNLTQAQQEKIQEIRTSFKTKADAIKSNTSLSQEQKRTQFQELMKQQREQMNTVLTKEQSEKLGAGRKDRKSRATK